MSLYIGYRQQDRQLIEILTNTGVKRVKRSSLARQAKRAAKRSQKSNNITTPKD